MSKEIWVVYLVRCSDNSLYCGITNDLDNRLAEHNSGKGAKYTRSRRPVELVCVCSKLTKSEALKLEYRIKRLPSDQKILELTRKESKMTISKRDLQSLQKEIKELEKKMDKMIVAAGKTEKPKAAKKAPVKKAFVKKKAAQPTATEQVLKIINRSKKGVDAAALVKKTGFNLKKVRNILHRTYKMGKIKRVEKGIYVGA
ncbi:MAG: GIY-YIG nuclease family protein [Desulfobacterales bacterium]|nr:GIY-YIG nuclease family protein [Desulfobacterales bacterium]